jgi:hypothetical protein
MPVPIRFQGTSLDTILVFDHTFSGQVFNRTITQAVNNNGVTIDPDLWLISANNTVVHDITLGENNIEPTDVSFHVFPNPANDVINIQYYAANEGASFTMTDMLGKIVLSEVFKNETPGIHKRTFNTRMLAAGSYHCELKTDKETKVLTVQIQK